MPNPPPTFDEEEIPQPNLKAGEEIKMKLNRVTEESLTSTRRMKVLCEEAKEAGIKTLVALDSQGEKLDKIEQGLRNMNEDMVDTEQTLQEINACCWGLCLPCTKKSPLQTDLEIGEDGEKGGDQCSTKPTVNYTNGGPASKILKEVEENDDEMEKSLDEVSKMVGNLRHMSIDIGSEISNQNIQLRRINSMAEDNSHVLARASERAKKLFHR